MLRAGVSSKEGRGKINVHWLVEGKIIHQSMYRSFFTPSWFIIIYTADTCIAPTTRMRL